LFHRFRSLARHSAAYSAASMIAKASAFLIVPIYTRSLTKDEYASYVLLNAGAAVLGVVYELGISSAVMRFYYDYDDERRLDRLERRRYIGAVWLFALAVTGCLSLLLTLLGAPLLTQLYRIAFWPYVVLTIWGVFLGSANFIPWVLMRVREQSTRFVVLVAMQTSVLVAAAVVLVPVLHLGLLGAVLASFIQSCAVFVFYSAYTWRNVTVRASWRSVRPTLSYGLPVMALQGGWWVLDAADRFILGALAPLATVALYSVGYAVGRILISISQAVNQAFTPFFFQTVRDEDPEAHDVFAYSATYFLLVIAALGVLVIVFSHEAVLFFGGPAYHGADDVVPVIALAATIQGLFYVPSRGLLQIKRTGSFPWIVLAGAGLNVSLNLALIPSFGMMGASYATVAGYVIAVVATFVVAHRWFPVAYQWARMARILGVVVLEVIAVEAFMPSSWYARLTWQGLLLLAAPTLLLASGFSDRRERAALASWLRHEGPAAMESKAAAMESKAAGPAEEADTSWSLEGPTRFEDAA
jgi:O-antigen/teichoic acid export membrane protein